MAEDNFAGKAQVSPEAYPLALEVGRMGVWEWDVANDVTVWSSGWSILLGRPVGELPTTFAASLDLAHPEERSRLVDRMAALLDGAPRRTLEYRLRHADGGWRVMRGAATTIRDEDGVPSRLVLAAVDVTEQHLARREAELRDTLAQVLRRSAAALITATTDDIEGVVIAGVGRLAMALGADRAALLVADAGTRNLRGRFAWQADGDPAEAADLDSMTLSWLSAHVRDGQPVATSHREQLPDEATSVCDRMEALALESLFAVPVAMSGRVAAIVLFSTDPVHWPSAISPWLAALGDLFLEALARRHVERELEEALRHLEHLVDRAPLTMWRLRADSEELSYLSANTIHLLGVSADVMRHDWLQRVHPDDMDTVLEALPRIRAGEDTRFEARFRHADGRWLPFEMFVRPDQLPDESPAGAVGYSLDITGRRSAEMQLRRDERLDAIGQLAGGIAHDFNNLLAVMHGFMELAQQGHEGALEQALTAAERGRVLVDRLLTFSRQGHHDFVPVDLNALIVSMEDMIGLVGAEIDIRFDLAADLPAVVADVGQLEQAILNLVVNARDAMAEGGTLTVGTDAPSDDQRPGELKPGDYVRLRVADTGVGMSPEVETRALEPFFTTKNEGHGTGLGLPAVHGAVTALGGALHLDTEPGQGTTVHVFLPTTTTPATPGAVEAPRAAPTGAVAPATVLLVEDQPQLGDLIRNVLERAGYGVLVAEDGTSALAAAEGRRIDLLLTDVALPRMNGPEIARALRSSRPGLPVLYVSGYSGDALEDEDRAVFLQKPFKISDLVQAVAAALKAGHRSP